MPATLLEQRDALAELDAELDLALIDVLDAAPRDPAELPVFLQEHAPGVVLSFAGGAGALAAFWYDDLRDLVAGGGFAADAALPAAFEARVAGNVAWATGPYAREQASLGTTGSRLFGTAGRAVLDAHRETVMVAATSDPAAKGWGRFGNGKSCDFCRMLISRGAVYREGTRFASHDRCRCVCGPVFGDMRPVAKFVPSQRVISPVEQTARKLRVDDWITANL